jgi:hypothetical protein
VSWDRSSKALSERLQAAEVSASPHPPLALARPHRFARLAARLTCRNEARRERASGSRRLCGPLPCGPDNEREEHGFQ